MDFSFVWTVFYHKSVTECVSGYHFMIFRFLLSKNIAFIGNKSSTVIDSNSFCQDIHANTTLKKFNALLAVWLVQIFAYGPLRNQLPSTNTNILKHLYSACLPVRSIRISSQLQYSR